MSNGRDDHGQPVIEFRKDSNRNKLFSDLLGVCEGLTADETLNDTEVAFLDAWLKESRNLFSNDPDVIDIQDAVQDVLADNVVTQEELEDILGVLDCVVRHRAPEYTFDNRDQAIDRLLGVARGLIADRTLNDREISYLQKWLRRCKPFIDSWPFNALTNRIEDVLADGLVTEEERTDLIDALSKFIGGAFIDTGSSIGSATRAHEMDGFHKDPVIIQERSFLFTGKFVHGPRNKCEAAVLECGGIIASGVSRKLNYLVVGTLSSRDWMHEAFGRKIESAMQLRAEGHPIAVISEEYWIQFLPR